MRFSWCTLLVKDMDESLRFYQDVLGLEVDSRFSAMPGLEIAFLKTGETQLELVKNAGSQSVAAGDAVSWGFQVDSLDDALAMIREKDIPIYSGPFIDPTVKYFFIQDPNGLKIQLKQIIESPPSPPIKV
ncbi:lactoylglutathione lyase [Sporobacter termitidis DSM 10068]|uniref:Lactoylglutathione lyase n=1 Tax=Sporobacter termitidis DSM 10068 TaxID=1123282 RepID=A0A1M5ZH69_9FIRM|nr:VOC family protein [Sporobacter termitidis]SHI23597.1 lactoylglutathione lyase [Sporobacter termitidis DSM 10068]